MSVVKINAISIPEGMGPQLEGRFAGRAKMVEQFEGFEDFQLLRPVEGETRYFVYTRWETEEHFQKWLNSQEFGQGHANAGGSTGGHPGGPDERRRRTAAATSRSPRVPTCSASKSSNTSSRAPETPPIHVCVGISAAQPPEILTQTRIGTPTVGRRTGG